MKYADFNNIIFDLGGVIWDIDIQKANKGLHELGVPTAQFYADESKHNGIIHLLQEGKMSAELLYEKIKEKSKILHSIETIKEAWNTMFLEIDYKRIDLLQQLKTTHRIFLLSNTDIVHYEYFTSKFKQETGTSLADFFEAVYYSHLLGMIKPSKEIFQHVLSKHNLKPADTLFIDDTLCNCMTAKKLGLHVIHLQAPTTILDFQ